MISNLKYLVIAVLLLFVSSNQLNAKEITAKLLLDKEINLCSSDSKKNVIVLCTIGLVKPQDSLFGYDFFIKYDPDVVRFENGLYLSNISEQIPSGLRGITILDSAKQVRLYGVIFGMKPLVSTSPGDSILVGLLGEFIGDCSDTTELQIQHMTFTDEFQNEVVDYKSLKVSANTYNDENYFDLFIEEDELRIKKDSSKIVNVFSETVADRNLSQAKFIFNVSHNNFKIKDILVKSNKIEFVDESIINENEIEQVYNILDNLNQEHLFEIEIENEKGLDTEAKLTVNIEKVNTCDCISIFNGDQCNLMTDPNSGIYSDNRNDYIYCNDNILRVVEGSLIHKIEIYDLNGSKILSNYCQTNELELNISKLASGVYFAVIYNSNDIINRKCIIKY